MSDYWDINIYYKDINYCPFCGKKVVHSSYWQEEDWIHNRHNVSVVKCPKCGILFEK
jgi:transcription elongation factor Elf1